jgi:hypothetical protein
MRLCSGGKRMALGRVKFWRGVLASGGAVTDSGGFASPQLTREPLPVAPCRSLPYRERRTRDRFAAVFLTVPAIGISGRCQRLRPTFTLWPFIH